MRLPDRSLAPAQAVRGAIDTTVPDVRTGFRSSWFSGAREAPTAAIGVGVVASPLATNPRISRPGSAISVDGDGSVGTVITAPVAAFAVDRSGASFACPSTTSANDVSFPSGVGTVGVSDTEVLFVGVPAAAVLAAREGVMDSVLMIPG